MKLEKLFEMQKILRDRIDYKEQDRFNKLILALLVELGECANEWRGFKFWSKNQEPRIKLEHLCPSCNGTGDESWKFLELEEQHNFEPCIECDATGKLGESNPLLEEYVDGLHFVLELGLELGCTPIVCDQYYQTKKVELMFIGVYSTLTLLQETKTHDDYYQLVMIYVGLGYLLGFSPEQIEQAYINKNKINHERQDNGY